MKHFKKPSILLVIITVVTAVPLYAQASFSVLNPLTPLQNSQRAKEIVQDNEYKTTGYERGTFYSNPLMLNGNPLDFNTFQLSLKGELTVVKGAERTGKTVQVPFNVSLICEGVEIDLPGIKNSNAGQIKVNISDILQRALPGDIIVIQPVNKEDGPAKRILKIPEGC
jgi:hypothetical protein